MEEEAPKFVIFTSLFDSYHFIVCLFPLLQGLNILPSLSKIRQKASLWYIASLPNINWLISRTLHNKNSPGIQALRLITIIKIFHHESASDFIRVFWLMGAHQKYSWADRDSFDRVTIQPFVEPNQLCHESHIGIGNLSFLSDKAQSLVKSDLLCKYHKG